MAVIAIGSSAVVQGATRTFEVDLDVAAGDFIGIYGTEGSIDRSDSEGGVRHMV